MQVAMSTQHRVGVLASAASAPWVRAGEGSSRKAVRALLERFGLTAWADVLTDELSTGTGRICDLAAQVAAGPKILLLDEPTRRVPVRRGADDGAEDSSPEPTPPVGTRPVRDRPLRARPLRAR